MSDLALILIIILVIVLLLRGPRNLPRLGEAAGSALRNARRAAGQRIDKTDSDDPGAGT
jgi:Sec-independent protein translocase protein TatA